MLVAGVLRLVDQEVVDAEIELEMNPGCFEVVEQLQRLVDQIVVIEQAATAFLGGIAGQDRIGDRQQRFAAVAADHGVAPIENAAKARLLVAEKRDQSRVVDRAGDDAMCAVLPSLLKKISR